MQIALKKSLISYHPCIADKDAYKINGINTQVHFWYKLIVYKLWNVSKQKDWDNSTSSFNIAWLCKLKYQNLHWKHR